MPAKKVAKKAASHPRARVRTYRHGLGDCHLLTFRKPDGSPFHILIDCGVVDVTPNPGTLMSGVASDVTAETDGELDVVVATHAHTDHLSGFKQAGAVFAKMKFHRLWLAWTEDKTDPLGLQVQRELVKQREAVRLAVKKLKAAKSPGAAAAAARIEGVLGFSAPASLRGVAGQEMEDILLSLQKRPESDVKYHLPASTFLLPGVPDVRVYVLGPPRSATQLKIANPRKSKHESYEPNAVRPDAVGLVAALLPGEQEADQPFDPVHRVAEAGAAKDPKDGAFFASYLSKSDEERRIDTTWLEAAEQLALFLDDYTNNTSLALAFEFIDTGEVMLLPGDAQIGNWLSWHGMEWKFQENGVRRTVTTADLFSRVVFYKVAHHASHNGTLSGLGADQTGLEQMTSRDLVCVVPVDLAMSKKKHWDRTLPWPALLDALKAKTRGRLILTDTAQPPPTAADLAGLTAAERASFADKVKVTPAYVEWTLE